MKYLGIGQTLSFILSFLLLSYCKKQEEKPIADFDYLSDSNVGEVEVNFINKSTFASSYQWDFGDGGSSFEKDPVHSFINDQPDTMFFSVCLRQSTQLENMKRVISIRSRPDQKPMKKM